MKMMNKQCEILSQVQLLITDLRRLFENSFKVCLFLDFSFFEIYLHKQKQQMQRIIYRLASSISSEATGVHPKSNPFNLTLKLLRGFQVNTNLLVEQGNLSFTAHFNLKVYGTTLSKVMELTQDALHKNGRLSEFYSENNPSEKRKSFKSIFEAFGILENKDYSKEIQEGSYVVNNSSSQASQDLLNKICSLPFQEQQIEEKLCLNLVSSTKGESRNDALIMAISGTDKNGKLINFSCIKDIQPSLMLNNCPSKNQSPCQAPEKLKISPL